LLGPWLCIIALLVNLTLISVNMGFFLWFVPLLALVAAGGRLVEDGEPSGHAQPQ
jgi:hypothetical protein